MKFCIFHDYEFIDYKETEILNLDKSVYDEYTVKCKCKKCGKEEYFSSDWNHTKPYFKFEIIKLENTET